MFITFLSFAAFLVKKELNFSKGNGFQRQGRIRGVYVTAFEMKFDVAKIVIIF